MDGDERIDARKTLRVEQGPSSIQQSEPESLPENDSRSDAPAQLQIQNERFQRIIENTDAGYFRVGMDGRYEDVNPAWLRMHGFTRREDVIGLHFSAVHHQQDIVKSKTIVESLRRGESVKSDETSRVNQDGTISYHTFSANPVLDGDRVIGVEGFLIDITERKRMEQALQSSEKKFSKAFQSNPAALTIADLTTSSYLEVNEAFEQITGYRRDEVIGKSWDELKFWTDLSSRDEALTRLLKDGVLRNWEFGFRKKGEKHCPRKFPTHWPSTPRMTP